MLPVGGWPPQAPWVVALTLLLAFGQALPGARFFASPADYLPLHIVLEFVAIAVSAMVFALAWSLRRQPLNSHSLLLGAGLLAVCLIDVAHTLSYAGMPVFFTPSDPEKAINFWLAGRYLAAFVLLAVALTPLRTWRAGVDVGLHVLAVALAGAVLWVGIARPEWLPRTFIAGQGLTDFKIAAEVLLAGLYATAAVLLHRDARRSGNADRRWLAAAAWVQGLAELFFTLYADVTDVFNLLGHVYKAIAYVMVYRALFVAGVLAPYRQLEVERNRLKTLLATIPDPIWLKDGDGIYLGCNAAFERFFGASEAEIVGRRDHDYVDAGLADFFRRNDQAAMAAGGPTVNEEWLDFAGDGYRGLFETTKMPLRDADGTVIGVLGFAHDITARTRAEARLRDSEQHFRTLADGGSMLIRTSGPDKLHDYFNEPWLRFTGRTLAQELGDGWTESLHPEDFAGCLDTYVRAFDRRQPFSMEFRLCRADGSYRWLRADGSPRYDSRGEFIGYIEFCADVTERREAEAQLRVAATTFESREGILITDAERHILRANRAFTEIIGYGADAMVGRTPGLFKSGRHDPAFYAAMWAQIVATGTWSGEIWNRRENGDVFPCWLTITAVTGSNGRVTHYVGNFSDISERKAAAEKIAHLAFYDALTQLPNRKLMLDRLGHALGASERTHRHGALLLIDLDDFKTLNDSLGHATGDRLLVEMASRLRACVRQGDSVARLGGDEFVVILEDLDSDAAAAARQAEAVAMKIQERVGRPFQPDPAVADLHSAHRASSSIGISLFLGAAVGSEELLKRVDTAMYQAKAAGRGTQCFFDPGMQAVVNARAAMEVELRRAIDAGQLVLHYQPQVAVDGRITGAEALVRWQHPERGLVAPDAFIPLAEDSGLIVPLGQWVMQAACRQLARWAGDPATAGLTLAVNVSARQFRQAGFVDQTRAVIADSGAPPQRLKLELTESLLLDDTDGIIGKMLALKALGVSFALDDFGTGYSSLAYLKRLPLDQLKIDRSFVRDVLTDPNDAAIARTVVALADSLGLEVIAEGVETDAQRRFLADSGCRAYQGYLFGRPLPLAGFDACLAAPRASRSAQSALSASD